MSTGETTILRRPTFLPAGRSVAAERGWAWIAQAWGPFRKAPGLWIGMIVVLLLLMASVHFLGAIGGAAFMVLFPVFAAGLAIAAAKLDHGEPPQFTDLFAGFQSKFGALAAVGAISLAILAGLVFLAALATGVSLAAALHAELLDPAVALSLLLFLLVLMALALPVMMATWFAPALIVFHDLGAVAAMKASLVGCARNVLSFLVYGVIGMVLVMLTIPTAFVGLLVVLPIFAISVYTSYKDIYLSP